MALVLFVGFFFLARLPLFFLFFLASLFHLKCGESGFPPRVSRPLDALREEDVKKWT